MNVGSDADYILEFKGIGKYFPGVQALKDVSFTVRKGEILALLGENGAGKSTLMKILAGAYIKDEGEIYIDGKPADITCPEDSERLGVAIIYQEFNLVPGLTVAENIFMRRQPKKNGMIDWKRMNQMAQAIIDEIDINIRPTDIVNTLTVAEQQMVEICKAVSLNSKILIMDEPTSALTESETQKLFNVVRSLNKKDVTMIFITHRMDEVFEICTNTVILRDGQFITAAPISELTLDQIIEYIVGRSLTEIYPERDNEIGEEYLEVRNLTDGGKRVHPSSFVAHKGEILGFAGLVGAGRTELMRLIFGADKIKGGTVRIGGKKVHIRNEKDAIRFGIGLVPEDRRRQGLVLALNVRENIIMANYEHQKTWFYLDPQKEKQVCAKYIDKLLIKTPGQTQYAKFLSGGNQQKIAVAKWLNCNPDIIILDEPTRGIDVNAKYEIYNIIIQLAREGKVIIFVSSELPELIGMCDRIIVMHEGKISGEVTGGEMNQKSIMYLATVEGGKANGAN